jgi:ketosteroid isomerase-like protein
MSQANVEVVKRLFESYRRGDYAEAAACLAPEVVYAPPLSHPVSAPAAPLNTRTRQPGHNTDPAPNPNCRPRRAVRARALAWLL